MIEIWGYTIKYGWNAPTIISVIIIFFMLFALIKAAFSDE